MIVEILKKRSAGQNKLPAEFLPRKSEASFDYCDDDADSEVVVSAYMYVLS